MSERNYYVLCDDNCRFESMTKEQIIAAIAEATGETPVHIDDAFITKIKEQNHNAALRFWIGTQAEYNALTPEENCFYIISDENTKEEIDASLENMQSQINAIPVYNQILYSGTMENALEIGDEVTLANADNFNVFLVKVFHGYRTLNIICNKVEDGAGIHDTVICGSGISVNTSSSGSSAFSTMYHRVALEKTDTDTYEVKISQYSQTADFEKSAGNGKVLEIRGLM